MIINLVPIRHDEPLTLAVKGDALTLNGQTFDFTPLAEGASLPSTAIASSWFHGDVRRIEGRLHLTLMLPHGARAPLATRFPQPIQVEADGLLALPRYELPECEEPSSDEH